jgi:hypothetical protein
VRERIGRRNDLTLVPNIFVGRAGGHMAETEFDLAILGDDRLDLIEVKAVVDARGLQTAVTRLAHYRSLLSGPGGRAWLVLPFAHRNTLREAEIDARARDASVTICSGNNALSQLLSEIDKQYAPRR